MTDTCVMVLQNCMDSLKAVPGSDGETCHEGNQVVDIKAEDITDIEVDEHPVLVPRPVTQDEQEVCLHIHCCAHFTNMQTDYCLCHL
jgi:hypothetical protein